MYSDKIIEKIKELYSTFQLKRYFRSRKKIYNSPYSLELYTFLLKNISLCSNYEIIPFKSSEISNKVNVYIRHDIDTSKCIKNLNNMLKIDEIYGVAGKIAVYFRVDDQEYSLKKIRSDIKAYYNSGFEIGLHSQCYIKDDYIAEFKRETNKFSDDTGLEPKSFTVHGLGSFRLETRLKFYKEVAKIYPKYGYQFGDIPQLRRYDYVIQDCHLDETKKRFIYDDFFNLPKFFRQGVKYLVLTHPCYWE